MIKRLSNIALATILFFIASSCLTYRWRAKVIPSSKLSTDQGEKLQRHCVGEGGLYDNETQTCKNILVTTQANQGDKTACYLTAILYGGWCWFVSPDELDYSVAKSEASRRLGMDAEIEYLGRR